MSLKRVAVVVFLAIDSDSDDLDIIAKRMVRAALPPNLYWTDTTQAFEGSVVHVEELGSAAANRNITVVPSVKLFMATTGETELPS